MSQVLPSFSPDDLSSIYNIVIMTLLVYEILLTLPSEIQLFWPHGFTSTANILFFANRYLILFLFLVSTQFPLSWYDSSSTVCIRLVEVSEVFSIFSFLIWAAYSALRNYALSSHYKMLTSAMVFILSCAPFVVNMLHLAWYGVQLQPDQFNFEQCNVGLNAPAWVTDFKMTLLSRIPLIVGELIVVIRIGVAAYKWRRFTNHIGALTSPQVPSLYSVLLRDGSIHFLFIFATNTLHTLLTLLGAEIIPSSLGPGNYIGLTQFSKAIETILVSRSLINLREVDQNVTQSYLTDLSSLSFRTRAEWEEGLGDAGFGVDEVDRISSR